MAAAAVEGKAAVEKSAVEKSAVEKSKAAVGKAAVGGKAAVVMVAAVGGAATGPGAPLVVSVTWQCGSSISNQNAVPWAERLPSRKGLTRPFFSCLLLSIP